MQEDSKEYKYSLLSSHINSLLLETSGFTGSFYTTFLFLNRIIGNYASFSRIRRIISLFSFCPVLSYSYLFILMISSVQSRQSIAFYLLFANIRGYFSKEITILAPIFIFTVTPRENPHLLLKDSLFATRSAYNPDSFCRTG